jgi:transcriptional regulator with XRE-family HTH domain
MKKQPDDAALERYSQEHGRCLGVVVRELRTERGLTQHEVAKRAKVSLRWVQRLEDNQLNTNYSIGRLYQVACALGVELYEFYKRADEMAGPAPWLRRKKIRKDNQSGTAKH